MSVGNDQKALYPSQGFRPRPSDAEDSAAALVSRSAHSRAPLQAWCAQPRSLRATLGVVSAPRPLGTLQSAGTKLLRFSMLSRPYNDPLTHLLPPLAAAAASNAQGLGQQHSGCLFHCRRSRRTAPCLCAPWHCASPSSPQPAGVAGCANAGAAAALLLALEQPRALRVGRSGQPAAMGGFLGFNFDLKDQLVFYGSYHK